MWKDQVKKTGDANAAAYRIFVDAPESVAGDPDAGEALLKLLSTDGPSPAGILLSALAAGKAAIEPLRKIAASGTEEQVKLHNWSLPVSAAWPARMALSRLGDADSRQWILIALESATPAERIFALDSIGVIDDPTTLHQVAANYLNDESEISSGGGGVPSGAGPHRRIADYAVDQLIERLKLPVSFERRPSARYEQAQIDETRQLIRQSIPS